MAKYRVEIKKSAVKEIERLPQNELKAVLGKIEALSENPRPFGCTKLSAQEKYRIRCGNYRIIYSIADNILTVYVVRVGHRKDVYKNN